MNNKGLTLIELVIYAAAFIMVTMVVTLFAFNLIRAQTKIRISQEVLDNAERAMEVMIFEIKHAKNIYSPTSNFSNHPGQLTLETARNTPQDESITYLDFYLDGDERLCLKREGTEPEALVSENIKIINLVFNYLVASSTESVQIQVSATYSEPTGKIAYQATTTLVATASLRND